MNSRMQVCAYVRVYGIVRPDFAVENSIEISVVGSAPHLTQSFGVGGAPSREQNSAAPDFRVRIRESGLDSIQSSVWLTCERLIFTIGESAPQSSAEPYAFCCHPFRLPRRAKKTLRSCEVKPAQRTRCSNAQFMHNKVGLIVFRLYLKQLRFATRTM